MIKNKGVFVLLALLALIAIGIRFSGITDWLTLSYIQQQAHYLTQYIEQHYWLSVILYIVAYVAAVSLALPFTALFTITGGFLFGTIAGTLYTNIGATTGALIVFLLVRYSFGQYMHTRYQDKLKRFNALFEQYGTLFLLMVRFVVLFPFFLVNILAGLTPVSLWNFVWTTALGILPGSMVFAFAGRQLHEIKEVKDIFSLPVILAFLAIALFMVIPIFIRRLKKWHRTING